MLCYDCSAVAFGDRLGDRILLHWGLPSLIGSVFERWTLETRIGSVVRREWEQRGPRDEQHHSTDEGAYGRAVVPSARQTGCVMNGTQTTRSAHSFSPAS